MQESQVTSSIAKYEPRDSNQKDNSESQAEKLYPYYLD